MGALPLGWIDILRLGLVQSALGAVVVLTTSTLNRVMVVELALPAMLPGALVALYYALQVFRPRFGFGSDVGGRSTPWIVGGMAVLAVGGIVAASATALMASQLAAGIALAIVGFVLIGFGVGAASTTLFVLLAKRTDERRRPLAATAIWLMMVAGFVAAAATAGSLLDPFSPARLVAVASGVSLVAFAISLIAVWRVENGSHAAAPPEQAADVPFRAALRDVWSEPASRRFAVFVFISMLAFSAQDLILEPFAGTIFGYTPGQSTQLSGFQNGGMLAGIVIVALAGSAAAPARFGSMKAWTVGGCLASAAALAALALAGFVGPSWPLRISVFALGVANGAYAIAAVTSMMALAGRGTFRREGVRMGLWGAAQAIAFGSGGFAGTVASDVLRYLSGSPLVAYASVFAAEAVMFLAAALLALRLERDGRRPV